jgi:uncharacterized membrane protein YdjX (TVP38/TMEM64 family)
MQSIIALIVAAAIFIGIYFLEPGFFAKLFELAVSSDMGELSRHIKSYGGWSMAVSVLLGTIINISGLPTVVFSGANGLIFGFWPGVALSWVAEVLGAIVAFGLARPLLKKGASRVVESRPGLQKAVEFTAERGFWAVFIARLLPFSPSGLINVAAAVGKISFRDYLIATGLGKIPSIIAEVYLGRDILFAANNTTRMLLWLVVAGVLYGGWKFYRQKSKPSQSEE